MWALRWARRLDKYEQARLFVRNALHGRSTALHSDESIAARMLYHHAAYRNTYLLLMVAYTLLAMFEPPVDGRTRRAAWMIVLELLFLAVAAGDSVVQYFMFGRRNFLRQGRTRAKGAILVALLVNLIVTSAAPVVPSALRALRPFLIVERMRNVRRIASNIVSTLPRVLNVGIMLAVHVLFFGVLAFVLFAGVDGTRCAPRRGSNKRCSTFVTVADGGCSDFFSTLPDALMQMFILSTTANYPVSGRGWWW